MSDPSAAAALAGVAIPPRAGTPVDEADRIRAIGREIVLVDGTTVLVRFGFRVLAEVEKRFGSVAELADAVFQPYLGKSATAVLEVLSICSGMSQAEVEKRLDLHQLPVYLGAIDQALREALPVPEAGEAPKDSADDGSTGEPSTTQGQSPSDGPTPNSG